MVKLITLKKSVQNIHFTFIQILTTASFMLFASALSASAPLSPNAGGNGTRAIMQVREKGNKVPSGTYKANSTILSGRIITGTHKNSQSNDFGKNSTTQGYSKVSRTRLAGTGYTWNGTISNDWTDPSNWTPNGVPDTNQGAIIPNTGTTTYAPTLPAIASCIYVQIAAGGVLNAPDTGGVLTVTGADNSWDIESGGVFNANTSTVLFNADAATVGNVVLTGTTGFYNLTIANGTSLTPSENSYLRVAGALTNNGTLAAAVSKNTIEFNGSSPQDVINPNGSTPGFYNLTISGSGTKNANGPVTIANDFNLTSGQFILNNATSNDLIIGGNFTQTGGVFDFNLGTSGTCNMYLSGNFTQTTSTGTMTTSGAGAPNGTVIFNGSGVQTFNVASPDGPIWVIFSIATGSQVKLLSNVSLYSADAVSQAGFQGEIGVDGTLDIGTYTVYQNAGVPGTAVFTINKGATFITSNSAGIPGSVSSTNMTETFSSEANYEFRGTNTGTFTTTPAASTVNNLTINNSSHVTLTNSINVTGLLSLAAGTFTIGGNTLTISGSSPSIGNGNIDASASTISFAGSTSQNIPSGLFYNNGVYNLTVNNPNNVILNGSLSLKNNLNATTGRLDASTNSPTVSYAGSSVQTIFANQYLNDKVYNLSIDNPAGVSLNADVMVNNLLTVNSGNSLIINPAIQLNVAGTIANNAGISGLIVKSSPTLANGTLIFHNTAGSPVVATVEMYSKASWDLTNQTPGGIYKWQYFGIPVTTLTASPMFDGDYVREQNEAGNGSGSDATNRWIQLGNASTMTPFTGYEITQPAAGSYSFQGQLINNDFTRLLSYTPGADYPGQHLLSNPYTAAIDITQLSFGSDLDETVYLYNTGSLSDWTAQTGSGVNPGQFMSAPINVAGTDGIPGQIPSMQGFVIMTKTATHTLTTFGIPYNSVVVKNNDRQRVKSDQNTNKIFTRIDVSGSRFSDKMWIFTDPTCTHNFDNGWDGAKFLGTAVAPQIYAIENDGNYQVNSVDNINNTSIGFLAGEDRDYTLTFTHVNTGSQYPGLYLKDLQENTITDITASGTTYSFTTPLTSPLVNRFKIVTSPGMVTNNSELADKGLKIYNSKQTIMVQNPSDLTGKIIVMDISGRILNTVFMTANGITTIPTGLPSGTYLVKGITSTDETVKRIILP